MQSARLPLRQIMDSNGNTSPDPDTSRRRSGRVVRAPDKFSSQPSQQAIAKRKRDGGDEDDGDENDVPDLDDEDSDEAEPESDDEPTPTRKSRKSQSKRAKKPSAKKPKINGAQPSTSNRTVTLPRMPKKPTRLDTGDTGNGLYGIMHLPRRVGDCREKLTLLKRKFLAPANCRVLSLNNGLRNTGPTMVSHCLSSSTVSCRSSDANRR